MWMWAVSGRVGFGDLVESDEGYTVDLAVGRGYPAVTIRYNEGPRTMHVFSESSTKRATLLLDRASMAGWEPPLAADTVDDAIRQMVLDRIIAALSFGGYVVKPSGAFPAVRNQLEGWIQLEQMLAAAKRSWREDDELRRRWRDDTLEEHRHRDTPR
jgi:hypothetical protein